MFSVMRSANAEIVRKGLTSSAERLLKMSQASARDGSCAILVRVRCCLLQGIESRSTLFEQGLTNQAEHA
jgi:hypothetical protein